MVREISCIVDNAIGRSAALACVSARRAAVCSAVIAHVGAKNVDSVLLCGSAFVLCIEDDGESAMNGRCDREM